MKKLLSLLMVVAMLVTLFVPMTVQAAVEPITLSTTPGESVLLEAEDYVDDFIVGGKPQSVLISTQSYAKTDSGYVATETNLLSGGQALYSGSFGGTTVTLTFPVTVDKSTVFEMECSAGYVGHLNQNYWTLDGETIFTTAHNAPQATGGVICYLNDSANYPTGKYICKFLIPAGTHELTYQMPKRETLGGAFVLDYVKLTATDGAIPAISWKEEPAISTKTSGKMLAVTFTDSGIETLSGVETPVAKYLIEVYPKDTTSTQKALTYTFIAHIGDMKDAEGNVMTRPTNYTAHIPLSKIHCGTFYAKIIPVGVTYESFKGEAAVSDPFTVNENVPGYVNRYELEDYWKFETPNVVHNTKYASNGKFLSSTQGGTAWSETMTALENQTAEWWQDTYDMTFEVDLPEDSIYDIETVMGKNGDGYVDLITVSVDDDVIYTNAIANASEELNINGEYSWRYLYACRYNAQKELSAGKHTVKFSIARPTVATQPHLFMMDYIQFKPAKPALSQNYSTTLEMEDYAANFIAYDEEGNTVAVAPIIGTSANVSGGKFITRDTSFKFNDVVKSVPVKADIPITVREAGYYTFEVLDSHAGSDGHLTITGANGTTTIIDKFSKGVIKEATGLDSPDETRANFWTYYNIKWHGTRLSNSITYLPEGDYTLTVHFDGRTITNGISGMAFCMDYVKVIPFAAPETTVYAEGKTIIEAEDYVDYFMKDNAAIAAAAIKEHESASGGMLATKTEAPMKTGHTLTLPIIAEKAGWYDMDSVISVQNEGWTSCVTLSVNGEKILDNAKENVVEDLSEPLGDDKFNFIDKSYRMQRFAGKVYLLKGENELILHALPRTNKTPGEKSDDEKLLAEGKEAAPYRVGYFIDNITFAPVTDSVTVTDTISGTVLYDEAISGQVVAAAYKGKKLVGIQIIDMDSEITANIDLVYTEQPDSLKVMAFDNVTNIKPVTAVKEFTFNK